MKIRDEVLIFLIKNRHNRYSPTEIGIAIGKDYNTASSSVSPAIKKLETEGLVIVNRVGRIVTVKLK